MTRAAATALRSRAGVTVALLAVTALAGWLRLVDLERAGLGNLFYAAAVRSMSASWHNFLYAAYDPAGTVLIDKPPLALWLQVAFAKTLGFEGTSLILPMALAGTVAVPLAFAAARRSHGLAVGLVAALLLAVLPESVATARDSTMDALMMAMLAGGAWLLVVAVEERRPRLLLGWAVLMGLVFNVKFFQGFLLMPAATLYIGVRWRDEWRMRLPSLAAAAAVLAAVSIAWVSFVELTPASQRPIVMNDPSNSEFGLVLRYNGIERLLPGEVTVFAPYERAPDETNEALVRAARHFGVGDAGPLRLFSGANGPLLGLHAALALLGVAAVLWRRRDWLDGPGTLWVAWGLSGIVLFSFSNRAAAHYTESYAPALAVLGAVAIVEAWRARERWRAALLPLAALGLLAYAWSVARDFGWIVGPWTAGIALAGAATAVAALVVIATPTPPRARDAMRMAAAVPLVLVPLVAALWIAVDAPRGGQITRPNPLIYARYSTRDAAVEAGAPWPSGRSVPAEAVLARAGDATAVARYRFAIDGVNVAGEAIAYTGASVLPVWSEYDRRAILPEQQLASLLSSGEVPYVLLGRRRIAGGLLSEVLPVVQRYCEPDRGARVGDAWVLWRCPGASPSR